MSRLMRAALTNGRLCGKGMTPGFLSQPVRLGTNPHYRHHFEPDEVFNERFMKAFNHPEIDGWWLRRHLQDLHDEDAVPEPEIVISILKACRKLDDLALAIRYLETLDMKCSVDPKIGKWLYPQIEPTMKKLGIPSLKELGYDEPELALLDYDDDH